ncbi:hypothetical protein B296_00057079 [Ensete ventricosum]|uniref:Retrotransposon gag domain-containing protein n=1 Tax=Ensete ventricosum TaxID=4639 RepID=A0A426WZC2_ENSVE|nr:hypothetical protein B296_00057079 [Ensete ventricosum]
MSPEHPFVDSGTERQTGPDHPRPTEEVTAAVPTPNRFWRMMTDPGFPSPASNPAPLVVTAEAFLGLTSQVQALVGMVQTIISYLPQLAHSMAHQPAPPAAPPQTESPMAPNRGIPPSVEAPPPRVVEVLPASPTPTPARSQSRSYNPTPTDLDTLSTDSLREQVRGSPFTPKIQSKPLPATFRLPTLEPYDGSGDLMEHIATFCSQMALYDTLEALMCRAFPTTLRGSARTWYARLKTTFIPSFDVLAREFELNFLASVRPRPITTSLLGMAQGSVEPLSQFVGRFTSQIQGIPDLHPSLAIQAFLTGLRQSRFFWSLIERPPTTLPEMLQRAHRYMAVETLIAGKRDETKRSRGEQSRGHLASPPKRREDRSGLLPARPPPIPLNSTRTEIFFQIREKGLLKAPSPMKSHPERRDKRRYCRFHREYDHDIEECRDLQYQIEDLIRRGHLRRYVREQLPLPDGRLSRDLSPRP